MKRLTDSHRAGSKTKSALATDSDAVARANLTQGHFRF